MLRAALRKDLNQGAHGGQLDDAERKALAWLEKASRPVSAIITVGDAGRPRARDAGDLQGISVPVVPRRCFGRVRYWKDR